MDTHYRTNSDHIHLAIRAPAGRSHVLQERDSRVKFAASARLLCVER